MSDAAARSNRLLRRWSPGERCIAVEEIVYVRPRGEPVGLRRELALGVTLEPPLLTALVTQGTCGTVNSVDRDGCLRVHWDRFVEMPAGRICVPPADRLMLTLADGVDPCPWIDT